MNLDVRPAFQVAPESLLEPLVEWAMPRHTVTVTIDWDKGILDIFAEHEADPLDWDLTCCLLKRMGLSGQLGRPEYLKGIDVWRIQLVDRLRSAC